MKIVCLIKIQHLSLIFGNWLISNLLVLIGLFEFRGEKHRIFRFGKISC